VVARPVDPVLMFKILVLQALYSLSDEATEFQIKEGRIPERWKDSPAKIRQKDRDARWSVKYTKAKVKEGADPKASSRSIWPSRCSATRTMSASTGRTG